MRLRQFISQLARDSRFVIVLALAAVPVGFLTNRAGPQPLSLTPKPADQVLAENLGASTLPHYPAPTFADIDRATQALESGEAVFVDARETAFFELGHIPGAVNLPRSTFQQAFESFSQRVKKDHPLIVYCSESSCVDSSVVAKALVRLGYSKVEIYQGGWEEWEAADQPREP